MVSRLLRCSAFLTWVHFLLGTDAIMFHSIPAIGIVTRNDFITSGALTQHNIFFSFL